MAQFPRNNGIVLSSVGVSPWHGVDRGGHVHSTFARGCSWNWCKFGEFLRRSGLDPSIGDYRTLLSHWPS